MKNSKVIITLIIILLAVVIAYFSGEQSYQVTEVTKEIKLDNSKN